MLGVGSVLSAARLLVCRQPVRVEERAAQVSSTEPAGVDEGRTPLSVWVCLDQGVRLSSGKQNSCF